MLVKHKLMTQYKNVSLRRKEIEVLILLLRTVEMPALPDAGSVGSTGGHAL